MFHQIAKFIFMTSSLMLWTSILFASTCHPKIDVKQPQYIIGYGSLINEDSKHKTDPSAKENVPVIVTGYERSWSIHSGYKTFLSVHKNSHAHFNGVIYQLSHPKHVYRYDKREKAYCRKAVDEKQIQIHGIKLPVQKQIWIYTSAHSKPKYATEAVPIFQSYIDIFLRGCLEIEEKFKIPHFAETCIKTTSHWPNPCNKQLIIQRDPLYETPYEHKIDNLLKIKDNPLCKR